MNLFIRRGVKLSKMRALLWAAVLMAAILFPGCSTPPKDSKIHNQDYLRPKQLEESITQQAELMESQNQGIQHVHEWCAFQKNADILLNLRDQETIEIIKSRVSKTYPANPFAIPDLPKYFPPSTNRHIKLAVVMIPGIFPAVPEKPGLIQLMQTIDLTLWRAGVKRCVFETKYDEYFLWVDSTESNR